MRKSRTILAVMMLAAAAACGGGGNDSPTSPTPPPTQPPPTNPPTQGTTVTIGAGGVMSPPTLTVPRGTRVTFINNDSRSRTMESDPHPSHEDCPEIGQVGFIQIGQTKQTAPLNTARTCGYHDHNEPNVRGSVIVQ